jgi:hypothetical protein
MSASSEVAVSHPSGWWKASDGNWYPPEQQSGTGRGPANDAHGDADAGAPSRRLAHTVTATAAVAVVAARIGELDLTLLFAGTSAAFFARWWMFVRPFGTARRVGVVDGS